MKHLKLYEGFFDKYKIRTPKFVKGDIPKELVESVVSNLSKKYKVSVSKPELDDRTRLLDRVKITCQTDIGNIDLVITLLKTEGMFRGNELNISTYFGKDRYVYIKTSMGGVDIKTGELKTNDGSKPIEKSLYGYPNSIFEYIKFTIDRVVKSNKARSDFQEFYTELTEDMIDLLIDLYDMIGEYKLEKKTVRGRMGFFVKFTNVPSELSQVIHENYGNKYICFKPSKEHIDLLSEIQNLYIRLKDGYGLTLEYSLNDGLNLIILQNEKYNFLG